MFQLMVALLFIYV